MQIILIRHAESIANVCSSHYSKDDHRIVLSKKGISQAKKLNSQMHIILGEDYKEKNFKIIASGLTRAKLTAQIALDNFDFEISQDVRLNERHEDSIGYVIETEEQVQARFKQVILENPYNLVIFTHCNLLMAVLKSGRVKNAEVRAFHRENFIKMYL